jgi:hypothetical protein
MGFRYPRTEDSITNPLYRSEASKNYFAAHSKPRSFTMPSSPEIPLAPRLFVVFVFACLGLSFVATTAVLAYEFWDAGWLDLATTDSHLFIFFPTLGIVALIAFYMPSCALVDLYWRRVPFGKTRFAVGTLLLCGLAYLIAADLIASPKRSIWEIGPAALEEDKGDPPGCARDALACARLPALQALRDLRHVSQTRLGLAEFIRDCDHDALVEQVPGPEAKRFCFASTALSPSPRLQSDADCCRAQERLSATIASQVADPERRSITSKVHAWLLPLKVFFFLVILAISLLLVLRHKAMEQNYKNTIGRIEFAVIVGTAAVLFFPFMSQAFVQSSEALLGLTGRGTFSRMMPVLSLAFGAWTLLMVLFFYRRRDQKLEDFGKMASAVAGAIAVLKYSLITAFFVQLLGSGASLYSMIGLLVVSAVAAIITLWPPWHLARANKNSNDRSLVDD